MSKWFIVPALMVLASSTPTHADWFKFSRGLESSVFTSGGGGTVVFENGKGIPSYGAPHGYPFYSGCCEARSHGCRKLWAGYCSKSRSPRSHCSRGCRSMGWHAKGCHSKGCGGGCGKSYRGHRHRRSSCGCGVSSCGGCGGGKGHFSGKGSYFGGSCGCGAPASFGGRCGRCRRKSLFGWMNSGHHSDCGCDGTVISGGKIHGGKGPTIFYDTPTPEVPSDSDMEIPSPAAPTPDPVSTQSAGKWWSPVRFLPLK